VKLDDEEQDTRLHVVVVNQEEQYSVWCADRPAPDGWSTVGSAAPRKECLARIAELWTDMRPLSLRRWMEEQERAGGRRL
jgi:MbtH protein